MKKKTGFISFRIEKTVIDWLRSREDKTGQNTPDFLRGIMWGLYHQYRQQELTEHVVREMDADKLKSLENFINRVYSFLKIPENRKLLTQYLLNAGRTLEQYGLGLEALLGSSNIQKKGERKKGKPENHKRRVRKNTGIKSLEKLHD